MKIEKINLKGEKKAKDRKKQGKRYIKPTSNKSENIKPNISREKVINQEKVTKTPQNVNNNLQIKDKNTQIKKNQKNKNNVIKNQQQIKKSPEKKNTPKTKNGKIGANHRSELLIDEIEEGIFLSKKNEDAKKEPFRADKGQPRAKIKEKKLKIIALGGLAEIGKNITVFEYGDDIVIVDAGLAFPDDDMLGVDLVIPDFTYLIENAHKIKGLLITHGHEDHIGAVPYLLSKIDVPVYGTKLSLGIIEGKLDEIRPPFTPRLYTVEAGDVINLGIFKAEFIHVNHSIADASAIALRTPVGIVFHSGDFKLDVSPIDGKMMDLTRIGEIGREGVNLLLCESTNAERAGFTPSERTVGGSLDRIFMQSEGKRLIIATFSSNVHRVQQIINASANHGRKVAVLGRSMINIIGAAAELGYMELPALHP